MTTMEQAEAVLQRAMKELTSEEASDTISRPFLSVGTAARYFRGYRDEARAAKNMLATFRYRRAVHADNLGVSDETYQTVYTELKKRSMFIGALSDGADPSSPVLVLRKRGEAFDKNDFEDYRRAFFFTLDCTARLADRELGEKDPVMEQSGQWVLVMDMEGYSSKNSPPIGVSLETVRIFQSHFPERAKVIIILDAPPAFNFLWRVVRPFIDPVTRSKFVFTSRSVGEERLREVVGEAVWDCINLDLDEGKQQSVNFMVDAGFLKENSQESAAVSQVS